ncbi:hypothetical protein EK21DRAFT_106097 [Setomelanomma holmii]|uniref:Uncharacterized protein n=1 Tax=Setomelanomma holmii TaxID=210430 RepID=A0A9P4HNK4_9PLEO|nr:hypothetical protein EK21DRAFT_106097 [Setomelanomma holmii]
MLRLMPSELTLTPEDVEETFRRMAQRQALKSARHVKSQPCGQPGRPVLRLGPQRAVRDAITTLGDIPILRPQPQQAIESSVDEDVEEQSEPRSPQPRTRVDSHSVLDAPARDALPVPAEPSTSSALRILQLPFRIGRNHRDSSTAHTQDETEPDRGRILSAPHSTHPRDDSRIASRREESAEGDLDASPSTPTRDAAALRGGGRVSKDRHRHAHRDISAPSPLRHIQDQSLPPGREHPSPDVEARTIAEEVPPVYLKGYFKPPEADPKGVSYWFGEFRLVAPQTEPRRRSGRQVIPTRSLSSGSAPTHLWPSAYVDHDDIAEAIRRSLEDTQPRTRQIQGYSSSSYERPPWARQIAESRRAASGSSDAFSYYQLPSESRRASSGSSALSQHHPQLDGAVASRPGAHGTYRSINPSQLQGSVSVAPSSSTATGPHSYRGISPLPSMPYGQTQSNAPTAPPPGLFPTAPSYRPNSYLDASQAAAQGVPSPLEPYSEYYQDLMYPQAPHPALALPQDPWQHPPQFLPMGQQQGRNEFPAQSGIAERAAHQFQRPSSARPPIPVIPDQPSRRLGYPRAGRTEQRSSENVPVAPFAPSDRPNRHSQVQRHREAFERLHNADLEHPPAPREAPNRPRMQDMAFRPGGTTTSGGRPDRLAPPLSSSPLPPRTHWNNPSPASGPGTSPSVPPMIPSRNASHGAGVPERAHTHVRHQVTPIPPTIRVNPARDLPSTSLALDHASATTSIRSPVTRVATTARPRPRLPPHRVNQENSGAAEEEMMRQEESAINARYGEDVERDVMDETPPRVGRVERRMFS